MEVSSLSRGIMFQSLSSPITGRRSLFPSSFARIPIGFPCGQLSGNAGGIRA